VPTVTQYLASKALDFDSRELPKEVIGQTKNLILNALGSAFMGHLVEPSQIVESLAVEISGPLECTLWGSGARSSLPFAVMTNVAKGANTGHWDKCYLEPEARVPLGPNRQLIPALMTVGEYRHLDGRAVLSSIVCAYEIANRLMGAVGGNRGLAIHGWGADCAARPVALAFATGRLLNLSQSQLVNAAGIAGTFGLEPRVAISPTTRHHLRSPMPAFIAVTASLLALKGYPGPEDLFEGSGGLGEILMNGEMDLDALKRPLDDWSILYTGVNRTSVDGDVVGLVEATLTLVKEHDIRPADVEKVVVRVNPFEAKNQGDPSNVHLRSPKTREVALHSIYYATAAAIAERAMSFDQFLEEKFLNLDPAIQSLMDKIVVEGDEKYTGLNQCGSSEITTSDGTTRYLEVLYPRGLHPKNQMTDSEHEENFRDMAGRVIGDRQMDQIIETVRRIDDLKNISELIRLLVV